MLYYSVYKEKQKDMCIYIDVHKFTQDKLNFGVNNDVLGECSLL